MILPKHAMDYCNEKLKVSGIGESENDVGQIGEIDRRVHIHRGILIIIWRNEENDLNSDLIDCADASHHRHTDHSEDCA